MWQLKEACLLKCNFDVFFTNPNSSVQFDAHCAHFAGPRAQLLQLLAVDRSLSLFPPSHQSDCCLLVYARWILLVMASALFSRVLFSNRFLRSPRSLFHKPQFSSQRFHVSQFTCFVLSLWIICLVHQCYSRTLNVGSYQLCRLFLFFVFNSGSICVCVVCVRARARVCVCVFFFLGGLWVLVFL